MVGTRLHRDNNSGRSERQIALVFFMYKNFSLLLLTLLLTLSSHAGDSRPCAATIPELKNLLGDQAFPLKWEETTMDDGKPLMLSILDKNGALSVEFVKTRHGLWAQSVGVVCKTDVDLEIRFTREQIQFGPAAGWLLRSALGNGGKFTLTQLGPKRLRVTTTGWSGIFNQTDK